MVCPKCGTRVDDQAHYCSQCGSELTDQRATSALPLPCGDIKPLVDGAPRSTVSSSVPRNSRRPLIIGVLLIGCLVAAAFAIHGAYRQDAFSGTSSSEVSPSANDSATGTNVSNNTSNLEADDQTPASEETVNAETRQRSRCKELMEGNDYGQSLPDGCTSAGGNWYRTRWSNTVLYVLDATSAEGHIWINCPNNNSDPDVHIELRTLDPEIAQPKITYVFLLSENFKLRNGEIRTIEDQWGLASINGRLAHIMPRDGMGQSLVSRITLSDTFTLSDTAREAKIVETKFTISGLDLSKFDQDCGDFGSINTLSSLKWNY